jgi:uncharacterized protein YcbK (DUF882 family)
MGDLSPHFSRWELACRCGCGGEWVAQELIAKLEQLRSQLGGPHIHVLSGCRCSAHNAAVGGTRDSRHLVGDAADIVAVNVELRDAFRAAVAIPFGGIGVYPAEGFLHVDCRPGTARWARLRRGGPYVGIPPGFYGPTPP